ncbi:hypothetical protein ACH5RR_005590 [Cinchona calisaya]|uniref:BZIP domain-containing protein n=1 Tax=Cinchona calisaya TaxID=153742 RepID=A0ABD3ALV9_9GENT
MVKLELEAAEALAGLAHSGVTMPLQDESDHESCHHHHLIPPKAQEMVIQERQEKISNTTTSKTVNDHDKDDELKLRLSVASSNSTQPLTEIEMEARRLRRVLANRESARQTIHRRQAMFEELKRKAAGLTLENENLIREKELAVTEYDSLKNRNDCLKEQMAKMGKPKAEDVQENSVPRQAECSASASSRSSFFLYNQTSAVPHWSLMDQPLDATLVQCSPPTIWRPDLFSDQRNSNMIANPTTLLYVRPFPCFFPLHHPINALPQSSDQNDRKQSYLSYQCSISAASKSLVYGEDCQPSLSLKAKTRISNSMVSVSTDEDLHEAGLGLLPNGGVTDEETYPNRTVLMPTPLSCFRPLASAGEGVNSNVQHDDASIVMVTASSSGHRANGMSKRNQELYTCKKPLYAGTAAEARKKRKELMKLKSVQAGQYHHTHL